jgi:phosphoglycolate phosphatase
VIEAVLFDLDGTLADTAADLGDALNRLRADEGLPGLPTAAIRPHVSQGVRGLLRVGFSTGPGDAAYGILHPRFLAHYAAALCTRTTLFEGVADLLDMIEAEGTRWGVVTNKTSRYTLPLTTALGLTQRAACIVSGDSAPRPKPAPDPLLLASTIVGIRPQNCLYVGDDLRDIEAGHAAGMGTVAVAWGYLGDEKPIEEWGAGTIIQSPAEILGLLA